MSLPPIDSFRGDFGFLSNFHPCDVFLDGVPYPSVEHAFQAAKTDDPDIRRSIRLAPTPAAAKKLGRACVARPDWSNVKLGIMENLLREKFSTPQMVGQLLMTGERQLIEGNWWGDRFWGVCNGTGENHLGKLLMKIRDDLRRPRA